MSNPSSSRRSARSVPRLWRVLRVAALGAAMLVVLLGLALGALVVALSTGPGQRALVGLIERAEVGGQRAEVSGLSGDLFGAFRLQEVLFRDEQGVWARLSETSVDWSPGALYSGRLQIGTLAISRLEISRRPVWQRQTDLSRSDGWVTSYALDRLNIARIELAPAVVPQFADSTLTGRARWSPTEGDVSARLLPLAGADTVSSDRFEIDLTFRDRAFSAGSARLSGPAGGLIAGLLRLAPGTGLEAALVSEPAPDPDPELGPKPDPELGPALDPELGPELRPKPGPATRSRLTAEIGGQDWLALSLTRSGQAGAARLALDGRIDLSVHPLTAPLAPALGGWVVMGGHADLADPGSGAPIGVSFNAGSDRARVSVQSVEGDEGEDGRLRLFTHIVLENVSPGAQSVLPYADVRATGVVLGPVMQPEWRGDLAISGLAAGPARFGRLVGPVVIQSRQTDLGGIGYRADLTATGVALAGVPAGLLAPPFAISSEGIWRRQGNLLVLNAFSARSSALTVSAQGEIPVGRVWTSTLNGAMAVRLPEGTGTPVGLLAAGALSVRWAVVPHARQDGTAEARFSVSGQASRLAYSVPGLAPYLGASGRFSGRGKLSETGDITLKTFDILTPLLRVDGAAARAPDGMLKGEVGLKARGEGRRLGPLTGSTARLDFQGLPETLAFTGSLFADRLELGGPAILQPQFVVSGQRIGRGVEFVADGQAETLELPLSLAFGARLSTDDWTVADLRATWAGLVLTGEGEGSLAAPEQSRLSLGLQGQDVAPLGGGRLRADLDLADGQARITASLHAAVLGPIQVSSVDLLATGHLHTLDYKAEIVGRTDLGGIRQPLTMTASGQASEPLAPTRQVSASFEGKWSDVPFSTPVPATFIAAPEGSRGQLALSLLGGQIVFEVAPDRSRLVVTPLRLAPIFRAMGLPGTRGQLTLEAVSEAPLSARAFRFEGALSDLRRVGVGAAPISLSLKGWSDAGGLVAELGTLAPSELVTRIDMRIPFGAEGGLTNPGVSGRIDGPVGDLMALIAPPRLAVEGDLDARFTLPWPPGLEGATGRIQLTNGRFEDAALGASLRDVGLVAELSDGMFRLTSFEGSGPGKGRLEGSGAARIGSTPSTGTISLTATDLVVLDRREGYARAGGTLGIEFAPRGIDIVGDLQVHSARIDVSRIPQASEPTLDVTFDDAPPDASPSSRQAIAFDVALKSTRGIDVTGQGVEAVVSLDARIGGSLASPQVVGVARLERGRFDLLGKRFVFAPGTVRLSGDVMQSELDLTATRQISGFQAIVSVSGSPRRPNVTLSSLPAVPSDEVLSRILFGRSPSQLSALEAARLASAVIGLSGGQGFDFLGGLERLTGLDTFQIDQGANGQVELTTGQYLNDQTYVELKTTGTGVPAVAVTWEARENVVVEAETTADEGQSLTIRWVEEFD